MANSPPMRRPCQCPQADKLRLKDPSQFRYIGKGEINIVDGFDITTGRAVYGQDVRLPGMKFAVIARPPVMGGKVKHYDAAETMKVPGVEKVVEIAAPPSPSVFLPMGGLAVVANNTWAAMKGREALKIDWDDGVHGSYDSKAYQRRHGGDGGEARRCWRSAGDAKAAIGKRGQEGRGTILYPSSCSCDDGAALRDRAHRRRQGRVLDQRPEPAGRP